MGDGERAAAGQLLAKQGHHAAAGPQHIAKAHHRKTSGARLRRQRLQHQFGHALARAHHIGGAHRLVSADQHKAPRATGKRGLRHVPGAKHIVEHALARVVLHQRHVFIGRCVVNRAGAVVHADAAHTVGVHHAAQERNQHHAQGLLAAQGFKLLVNQIQAKLVVVEQHQLARTLQHDAAAQLRANAAARAGDQHHLTSQIARQQLGLRRHGFAPEQVFNIKLAKILHRDPSRGQIGHAGQGAHVHRQRVERLDNGQAPLARSAGHGQQYVGDALFLYALVHLRCSADHDAIDATPHFGRVVIHKTYEFELPRYRHRHRSLYTGRARAKYQQALGIGMVTDKIQARQPEPGKCTARTHQYQKNEWLQYTQAARHHGPLGP